MREKRKRPFRKRLRKLGRKVRRWAGTAVTLLIVPVIFPGSCLVSTARGCYGDCNHRERTGVLTEDIQTGKVDVDCIKSKRYERRLGTVFGESTKDVIGLLKPEVKAYKKGKRTAKELARRVDMVLMGGVYRTGDSWTRADFWFSYITVLAPGHASWELAAGASLSGDEKVEKAHKLLVETCRK